MTSQFHDPLAGYPRTVESTDEAGLPVFTTTARELTPERARAASEASRVLGWTLGLAAAYLAVQASHVDFFTFFVAFAAAFAVHRVLIAVLTECLRKTTVVVMSGEAVEVRHPFGARRYSRDVRHQFQVLPHDLVREEQRWNEYLTRSAGAKGQVIQPPVYFGESGHVVLDLAGQRLDLLTVFGLPRALAIAARLRYCDEALNRAMGKSHGLGGSATDQQRRATPGGL